MANFPTDPKPNNIKIGSHYQTSESTTQSYRRKVATRGGHRWSFELSYAPLRQADFAPLFAFLHSLKGKFGSCTFTLPSYTQQSTITLLSGETARVGATVNNGTSLTIAGLETGTSIKAGDFFSITGSTKKYMVTQDVTTTDAHKLLNSGNGGTPLYFCPALIEPANVNTEITFNQDFEVSLNEDELYIDFPIDLTFQTSIKLIETTTSTGSQY